jgi:hypothetical protein
MLDLRQH